MAGVKIEDATLLQTIDGNVSIPVQQQGGNTAERITTGQMRQYVADTTNVSDLQGASDYARVSDIPTKTSELQNDSGFLTTETDPVFLGSPAAGITSQDITDWNNKSDFSGNYNDLTNKPTIPTKTSQLQNDGADNTSTYVEHDELAGVATSGDYNELNNLPTIPAAQVQADWDEADNTAVDYIKNKPTIPDVSGKADKVSGATNGDLAGLDSNGNLTDSGIAGTDVSDAVAKKHSHANKTLLDMMPSTLGTAGQVPTVNSGATGIEWQTPSGGSATDVQVNGTSVTVGGVANIVTETAYNASTNKIATVADLPSVPAISTDIQTDKTSTTKTASPSAVYNEVHPTTGSSQPVGGMLPNTLYKLGTLSGSVSITLASASDNTICNHYYFTFTADSTAPTITWDAAITSWNGGSAPTITASKHYEISVLDGVATYMEV